MQIRSFQQISYDHADFWIGGHISEPLLAQQSVFGLAKHYHLKRKTLQALMRMQNVGSVFQFGRRGKITISCLVLGHRPGDLNASEMHAFAERICRESDVDTAIFGEGFLLQGAKGKVNPVKSFQTLCRILRKHEFAGTLYEPPDYLAGTKVVELFPPDERVTDTRMLLTVNGHVRESIPPKVGQMIRENKEDK
ncbi:MAG: hypothetical protein ACOYUZ_05700 [Patescibacteria group bacterium]